MSVFRTKPQRALSTSAPQAAAKAAGLAAGRTLGKDALVGRFGKHANTAATVAQTVEITVIRQANNTVEATSTTVTIWFATTKDGPKGGTQTYGPLNTGDLIATLSANQMYQFQTDANGILSFDLTKPTAGTIYVRCQIGGQVVSEPFVWT